MTNFQIEPHPTEAGLSPSRWGLCFWGDTMEWIQIAQNFGFPAVVLVAVGYGIKRAVEWLAGFLERVYTEVIKPMAGKHIQFLEAATEKISGVKGDTEEILEHLKGQK